MRNHEIITRDSPIAVLVKCSCGWGCQINRRQNALARAAKVKAAVRQHLRETEPPPSERGTKR